MSVNGSFAKDLTIYANWLHVFFVYFIFLLFQEAIHGFLVVSIHFAKSEIITKFLSCCSVFSYTLSRFFYLFLFILLKNATC